jgi:hypothetical protein
MVGRRIIFFCLLLSFRGLDENLSKLLISDSDSACRSIAGVELFGRLAGFVIRCVTCEHSVTGQHGHQTQSMNV